MSTSNNTDDEPDKSASLEFLGVCLTRVSQPVCRERFPSMPQNFLKNISPEMSNLNVFMQSTAY